MWSRTGNEGSAGKTGLFVAVGVKSLAGDDDATGTNEPRLDMCVYSSEPF